MPDTKMSPIIDPHQQLFHKVPGGAIKTFFDDQNHPLFKRADLRMYFGIKDIKHNFKEFPSHYTHPRLDMEGGRLIPSLGRTNNFHDILINLDGSIEMTERSCKMTHQGRYRKNTRIKGHQYAITGRDN